MDEMNTTGWWGCSGCGVDAELSETYVVGCDVPCPDCAEPMLLLREWALPMAA